MKVLLVTWGCDLEDVSEPEITARWVREIAKDHEVTVFAVSRPDRFGCVGQQFPDLEVIEWRDVRVPASLERLRAILKPGYFPYYFRARAFLKELLGRRQFDVIHHLSPFAWRYPSPAAGLGVPLVRGPVGGGLRTPRGLAGGAARGGPWFMHLRKSDTLRLRFDPLLRRAYRETDYLLMAAPYVRDLLRPLPVGSGGIEIEHGLVEALPAPETEPTPAEAEGIRFLFVGRVIATKGVRLAIQALARAACRYNATLTVVGDGQDFPLCQRDVERLQLADRVHFLGWRTKAEVHQEYRKAHVFVFPSFREPTGGVLLEAMAHGLPIIACAYGGPDYLVDDASGIKVTPRCENDFVRDLAAAMDALAVNPALRARMANNAWSRARTEFGWPAKRTRIGCLYAQLKGGAPDR